MPLYEYRCPKCKHEIEKLTSFEAPDPKCPKPKCDSDMKRKISQNSFHLKGDGWYKDGYSKKT
jgi:putative FmdB family regulatory protein